MCLAQGPRHSDAGEARTRGPSVSSQTLSHCAPSVLVCKKTMRRDARLCLTLRTKSQGWGHRSGQCPCRRMRTVRRDAHPIPGPQSTCLNPLGGISVCWSGFGRFSSYTHLVCFKAYLPGIESQPLIFIMMMPSYHAYILQWYSQGSGESAHMRRRARTFATRLHKIWMQMNTRTLTNLSLASFLWDICKQWIPRLDAAQFGV